MDKSELITAGDLELVRGDVKVELDWIGEGISGDYNADDPDDEPLLRFSVLRRSGLEGDDPYALESGYEQDEWTPFRDASYCTNISATLPEEKLRGLLEFLMDEVEGPASQGHSIKRLCEGLSWIGNEGMPARPIRHGLFELSMVHALGGQEEAP